MDTPYTQSDTLIHNGFEVQKVTQQTASQVNYTPIKSVDIYSRVFRIRGRCIQKSKLISFTSQKGEGKVFNVVLLDDENGSIQMVFYNDMADKFYEMI